MRVTFLIDGFNLYGSIVAVLKSQSVNLKWLDVRSLLESYLYLLDKSAKLEEIYFFTAIQTYLKQRNPDKIKRHQDYIKCLESTGIIVNKGRFKEKHVKYSNQDCRVHLIKHEEKETDVAIGIKLFELLHLDKCDICGIVSGDTDLVPAVQTCNSIFPSKTILFILPYCRSYSKELKKIAPQTFKMNYKQYLKHQFPSQITLSDGTRINKPTCW